MSIKLQLILRYTLGLEVFFIISWAFLVAIVYFWGSATLTWRGSLYSLLVFQIITIQLTYNQNVITLNQICVMLPIRLRFTGLIGNAKY